MLLLAVGMLVPQAHAADMDGIVLCETLSIRQQPDTGATTIAEAYNGDTLTVLAEQGDWYHIRFDDSATNAHGEGYVLKRFVVTNPEYATALGNTFIYAMPSGSAKMVGDVQSGTQLLVIGEWDDFWAVNLRTASGFVRKGDVEYSGMQATPTARPTTNPTATPVNPVGRSVYVVVRDSSLRASPSAATSSSGAMVAGSYVVIVKIENGFGQLEDSGLWLSMGDLQTPPPGGNVPIETSEPDVFRYLVLNDGTVVYAEPNEASAAVDTLQAGDTVTVSQTESGFALVSYDRQRGWVKMTDLLSFHR